MDHNEPVDSEFASKEPDPALALREYVWFSIILLFMVIAIAVKTHL
jgi:hypothetical protein